MHALKQYVCLKYSPSKDLFVYASYLLKSDKYIDIFGPSLAYTDRPYFRAGPQKSISDHAWPEEKGSDKSLLVSKNKFWSKGEVVRVGLQGFIQWFPFHHIFKVRTETLDSRKPQ